MLQTASGIDRLSLESAFAVLGREIPCVTTAMSDEFGGPIPCGGFALIGGEEIGQLSRGESALVPVGVGTYIASAREEGVEIVKVSLPL